MAAQELLQLQERVRVISEVTRRFAEATTDYQRLLEIVARCLAETLKDACVLFLLDEQGEALAPCSWPSRRCWAAFSASISSS